MKKKYILIFMSVLVFISCSAVTMSPNNSEVTNDPSEPNYPAWSEIEPPLPVLNDEAIKYGIDISQEDNVIKEQIKIKLKEYKKEKGKYKVIFTGKPKDDYLVSASLSKLTLEVAKELSISEATIDISNVYFNERKIKSRMFRGGVYLGYFNVNFILPENIIRVIEGNSFSFLNNYLKEITIPDSVIGIDAVAFQVDESIEKITFRETSKLEYIGDLAFSYAKVREILIPASVTYLGESVFGDYVTTVTYLGTKPNAIKNNGNVFDGCANLKTLIVPNAENIDDPAWKKFLGGKFIEVRK